MAIPTVRDSLESLVHDLVPLTFVISYMGLSSTLAGLAAPSG